MTTLQNNEQSNLSVVEIATPFNTGTGFFIDQYNVIVTNEHVIRDNHEVIVKGGGFEKQIVDVLLIDEFADIALLAAPQHHNMQGLKLRMQTVTQGEQVTAMGHPYGLKFSLTNGVISNIEQQERGLIYLMHDAALNPGNSGGPLTDAQGLVIGINSFVMKEGENIGFALPVSSLTPILEGFEQREDRTATRCLSCRKFVYDHIIAVKYCDHCGAEVMFPSAIKTYRPVGVPKLVEDIITSLDHDVRLTREGRNHWNIQRGSALVRLSYHKDTGLIDGDAYLCRLPEDNIKDVYTYLLQENFKSNGLVFSVKGQFILLSLMIYDRHLEEATGSIMMQRLFDQADHYDDILVNRFGATWIDQ